SQTRESSVSRTRRGPEAGLLAGAWHGLGWRTLSLSYQTLKHLRELPRAKRLGQRDIRAALPRDLGNRAPIDNACARDHDDRHIGPCGARLGDQLRPVGARHVHIGDDGVNLAAI